MMMNLLNNVNNWSFLKKIKGYGENNINIPKNHFQTIKNKFNLWTKKLVFFNAFNKYENINKNTNLLYIDATSIYNKKGSENLIINPENKKKITKLNLMSTKQGFIVSVLPFLINKTLKDGSKTGIHDVKMINETLNKSNIVKNNSKNFYLIGDKAYKNKEKYKFNNKPITMITPDKINTINKNTKFKNKN
jgi:hypothetical protein